MRTTLTSTVLLLTITLGLAAGNSAFAGGHGFSFGGGGGNNNSGGSKSGISSVQRNFQNFSNGSNSNSGMNVKKSTPSFQQFNNNNNKPHINLNQLQNGNHNTVKKQSGFPGLGQFGQNGNSGNNGPKQIVKIPGFGQGNNNGNGNGNKNGNGIGFGKNGINIGVGKGNIGIGNGGIGIGLGKGNGNGNGNGPNKNHCHVGCYPWWKGQGYCGGYSHGCKTVIIQPVVQQIAVLAPELANLPTLQVGAKLTMQSNSFSPQPGVVMLQVDKLMFSVQVDDWQAGAVSFTVPVLMMTGPVRADLVAVDAAGNVLVAQAVMLISAPQSNQTAAISAQ